MVFGVYLGVFDCAMKFVSREGSMVLFRGLNMVFFCVFLFYVSIFVLCEVVYLLFVYVCGLWDDGGIGY